MLVSKVTAVIAPVHYNLGIYLLGQSTECGALQDCQTR